MVDLSELPVELIRSILFKLPLPDLVRSGAVCKLWQSVYRERAFPGDLPWLVLGDDDPATQTRGFTSLSSLKTHRLELPELIGKRCFGATRGWLVTVGPDLKIHLLHPFLRIQFQLPPPPPEYMEELQEFTDVEELLDCFIYKAIVTSDPCSRYRDCIVIALFGKWGNLAFCRLEDDTWTLIPETFFGWYCDMMYYKGQVYAISSAGQVVTCDIGPKTRVTSFGPRLRETETYSYSYLVHSAGDILLVLRHHRDLLGEDGGYHVVTRKFQVFKLEMDEEFWVEVNSIGDQALFLGLNYSLSVSVKAFPGCKRNSIYFTDDCVDKDKRYGYEDVGIYHLDDGRVESFHPGDTFLPTRSPAVWLIPHYNL